MLAWAMLGCAALVDVSKLPVLCGNAELGATGSCWPGCVFGNTAGLLPGRLCEDCAAHQSRDCEKIVGDVSSGGALRKIPWQEGEVKHAQVYSLYNLMTTSYRRKRLQLCQTVKQGLGHPGKAGCCSRGGAYGFETLWKAGTSPADRETAPLCASSLGLAGHQ